MAIGDRQHPLLRYLKRIRVSAGSSGVSDAELLRRFAASRDEAAFELLVWRHGAMVFGVCSRVLIDASAAEDAFQAVFLALARKASEVSRLVAPAGWLHRVAVRIALKTRTATQRRQAREAKQESPPQPLSAEVVAETAELAALLHDEIDRLASRYRMPVVLCYLEGKSYEEAAKLLGWPTGTVSGRLARAREVLKKRLLRRGIAVPAAGVAALMPRSVDASMFAPLTAATARGAAAYAAHHAVAEIGFATASQLANGAIRTMYVAKLKGAALACIAASFITVGTGASYSRLRASVDTSTSEFVAAAMDDREEEAAADDKLPPGTADQVLATRQKRESANNLRQIVLAQHNYHDVNKHFAGDITDKQGGKLLSWRVAVLPYLGEAALYEQFNKDEPWDSPTNKKLLSRMPQVYRVRSQKGNATETFYQGFAGAGTMFDPAKKVGMIDVTDGTSNTLFVVEARSSVPWTKPQDLEYDASKRLPELGGFYPDVFLGATADGAVHTLKRNFKESAMRAAIIRNDGTILNFDDLQEATAAPGARVRTVEATAGEVAQLRAEHRKLLDAVRIIENDVTRARQELKDLLKGTISDGEAEKLAQEIAKLRDYLARQKEQLDRLKERISEIKKSSTK
jgi:RNA polymerase sigma factor (sigma-70 family)